MTKSELRKLLSMIATPDTDPDTFDFVLKRLVGIIYGIESNNEKNNEVHN